MEFVNKMKYIFQRNIKFAPILISTFIVCLTKEFQDIKFTNFHMHSHFLWRARVRELVLAVDDPEVVYDGADLVVRHLLRI